MLSANFSNDGKYIRNLSCTLYDNGNEVSAIAEGDNSFGYKIQMTGETKAVKLVATAKPTETVCQYIASYTPGTRIIQKTLVKLVLPEGVYNQDEFAPLLNQFKNFTNGTYIGWLVAQNSLSNTNFDRIYFAPWNPMQQIFFGKDESGEFLPVDEPIVASSEISVLGPETVKTSNANTIVLSTETYPAVGYYTDYSMNTIINPSQNAACYAEYDIVDISADVSSDISSDISSDLSSDLSSELSD